MKSLEKISLCKVRLNGDYLPGKYGRYIGACFHGESIYHATGEDIHGLYFEEYIRANNREEAKKQLPAGLKYYR